MNIDLTKIQNTIETEVKKAIAAEQKRVIGLVNSFCKELIGEINNDTGVIEKTAPLKTVGKAPKTPKAKPAATKVKSTTSDDGDGYDITEVEDEEVEDSVYSSKTEKALAAIIKKRKLTVQKDWGRVEMVKLLILHDEDTA